MIDLLGAHWLTTETAGQFALICFEKIVGRSQSAGVESDGGVDVSVVERLIYLYDDVG